MASARKREVGTSTAGRVLIAGALSAAGVLAAPQAEAQQRTFHLDRLETPGGPDDGIVLYRPVTQPKPIFFAQLGIGYQLNPLHTSNVTNDRGTRTRSDAGVIQHQLGTYATVGFQFFDRATFSVTLPVAWFQDGENPKYGDATILGSPTTTTVGTKGPAVGDTRLDFRYVALRSADRTRALAPHLSLFAPSGTTNNFGGDGQVTALLGVSGEVQVKFITLVANTGFNFRPKNAINTPSTPGAGLGVGTEWRWAIGAFIPLKNGKFRIGGSIFGQTGLIDDTDSSSSQRIGNTFFTANNTPIEWNAEGRMKFGSKDQWWASLGAGTRVLNGYGAPDFRVVGLVGFYVPILDTDPQSPDRKLAVRKSIRDSGSLDSDHDGIPDDVDACVNEPEDHQGADPMDGCPAPSDKDGDGIPDQYDKCPDVAEDKDGIEDGDGCPEEDADKDKIPDAQDACPREPGSPSPDPKKNGCPMFIKLEGSNVRILQQVHFNPSSAVIAKDSFPMLQEIVQLLQANLGIRKMSIEGHTDSDGGAAMNLTLSKARAASVKNYLVTHGIDAVRLDSEGYGLTKPIEPNTTAAGKAANRRVEFKIVDEEDPNKVHKK